MGARASAPVAVRSVGHTGITVSDLARSVAFYRDLLGCEVSPPAGARASTLRANDPGFLHVCLKVADLPRVVALVRRAGYQAVGPIQTARGGPVDGLSVVYVRDPDGVVLELVEEPAGVVLEDAYFPKGTP